jgi:hypothetical protein
MMYGCADEAARKIERELQPRPTIRSGMSFLFGNGVQEQQGQTQVYNKKKA